MRIKTRTWYLLSLMLFLLSAWFWQLGEKKAAAHRPAPITGAGVGGISATNAPAAAVAPVVPAKKGPFAYRLSNTSQSIALLKTNDDAVLLRNAFIDTRRGGSLKIPDHLRSAGEPGSYVVQSRGVITGRFRSGLIAAGAEIISYIPNNAYLVRLPANGPSRLQAVGGVQSVLPYEPYYKLEPSLLALAVEKKDLAADALLRVTMFSQEKESGKVALLALGATLMAEEKSPFGPVLTIRPKTDSLAAIAQLPAVQEIETFHQRTLANDISRVRLAVSSDTVVAGNYLGLTGTNVVVNINDSGVDDQHPDLTGRVLGAIDFEGHGTHVAGIIASSGMNSPVVTTNVPGSVTNADFRGKAPFATLFSQYAVSIIGPLTSDEDLQMRAARAGAKISNNSWNYTDDNSYNSPAASYDAAVRDALPEVSGSQPLLFVFSAGNAGFGNNEGTGGEPDLILAPATAKNVITVGASENLRPLNPTNQFAGYVDDPSQVASFSSRGNVGIGVEGEFGRFKPDLIAPGTFVISTRATNYAGNPSIVISNMDLALISGTNGFGTNATHYYRYESGTSMSAGEVSGVLALMQEFFEQRLSLTNSPALMKALLINGSRSLGIQYSSQVNSFINYQGWGLVNLTNSAPEKMLATNSTGWPIQFFDQSPTNSLMTGQSQTRYLQLADEARSFPLRITLVWTDPPGNPVASIKLVNDLDLIVTNLDTGEVFCGNNFPGGSDFTQGGSNLVQDVINNVENVYLNARVSQLSTNYSVTVAARRVNVNAVTGQTNGIAQDYALVIATENPNVDIPITITNQTLASVSFTNVTVMTNGVPVLFEHVGANSPMGVTTNGTTNQWHFYVFTNNYSYNNTNLLATNVAFATFFPPNLSLRRSADREADIDLYVSTNAGLLNLDPAVMTYADRSTARGGTEAIIYTNSAPGTTYYLGVKSEDQQAAEYGFFAIASATPFSERDKDGNLIIHGLPIPITIPDGSAENPGKALIFGFTTESDQIRRVIVTNGITHELLGDLVGELEHNRAKVTLNNHSLNNNQPSGSFTFVYDDSEEGDILVSRHTDGPGSLRDFVAARAEGVWLMTMMDNVPNHTGRVDSLTIKVEPANTNKNNNAFTTRTILPNRFLYDFIEVPLDATNLAVVVTNPAPIEVYIGQGYFPDRAVYDKFATINPPGGSLVIGPFDVPPLSPGLAVVGFYNPNAVPVNFGYKFVLGIDVSKASTNFFLSTNSVNIVDDARTNAVISIVNTQRVADVEVGMTINHPRISDLVLHLIGPNGKRVLLMENRGLDSTNGFTGVFSEQTNRSPVPIKFAPIPFTNDLSSIGTNVAAWTNGFEGIAPGVYTNGFGWKVETNQITVVTVTNLANTGTNVLALDNGIISTNLPTLANKRYRLTFVSRAPPAPGPVSWWAAESNALDKADGNNGTPQNVTYAPGKVGKAFDFVSGDPASTLNSRVNVADSANLMITNSLTIETWLWMQIPAHNGYVYDRGDSRPGLDAYNLSAYAPSAPGVSPQIRFEINAGPANVPGTYWWLFSDVPTNRFFHFATVLDGSNGVMQTYVDGVLTAQTNTPVRPLGPLNPANQAGNYIGNGDPSVNFTSFRGIIDELSVYDRALTSSEVQAIFAAGIAGKATNNVVLFAQAVLEGVTNIFPAVGSGWTTNTFDFTPTTNQTAFALSSTNLGVLIDSLKLTELVDPFRLTNKFYLPEESLKAFVGDLASGPWQLEVWDTRIGALVGAQLVNWYLHLTFPPPINPAQPLVNGVPVTNTVAGAEIKYFTINVPGVAGFATNTLVNFTGGGSGLSLFFNQNGVPSPGQGGNYTLLNNVTTTNSAVLTTNGPAPLLQPGQQYYLGVKNNNPAETNTFSLQVSFDQDYPSNISVTILTNGFLLYTNIAATNVLQYFGFDVSSNAISTAFEIKNPNGDVDLVLRKGTPLPNPTSFDYHSIEIGSNDELIVVTTNTPPVPLSAGRWYLGVYNLETNTVSFAVRATEETPFVTTNIIDLISDVPTNSGVKPGAVITTFFRIVIADTNASDLLVNLYNLTGDVDLVVRRGALPTVGLYDYQSHNVGTNTELILIRTNAATRTLTGEWYIGVPNNEISNVTFTISASVITNGIITIPGTISITNTLQNGVGTNAVAPGPPVTGQSGSPTNYFYRFPVTDTNTAAVLFEIYNLTGDLDLHAGLEGGPLNLSSSTSGTNAERIIIRRTQLGTNIFGNWILAVRNNEPIDVGFTIRATISTNGLFASEPPPQFTSAPRLNAQGLFELTFATVGNERYEIQSSPDLITWTTIATITATSMETTFVDPNPPNTPMRFYRVRQLF